MKRLFAALLSLTLLATAAAAADAPAAAAKPAAKSKTPSAGFTVAPSGWYAEFRGGIASEDVPDLDGNIAYWEAVGMNALGAPGDLHRFTQAPVFALELGRRHGRWGFGVETQWQRQRVDNFTSGT